MFAIAVDDRAVKVTTGNLLKYFRTEDVKNRVNSGTEEQHRRLEMLLAVDRLICTAEKNEKAEK